jgi:hypothetical protein
MNILKYYKYRIDYKNDIPFESLKYKNIKINIIKKNKLLNIFTNIYNLNNKYKKLC